MLPFQPRSTVFVRNLSTLSVLACASAIGASAQQAAPAPAGSSLFAAVSAPPMDLANLAGAGYSSSSSSLASPLPEDPGSLNLSAAASADLQPPPRRRYGRPRYNDSSHNADGSNKYVFEAAVGLTLPLGNTYKYFNTGYAFQAGGGRQFSNKFAVLLQFDYDNFGVNKNTLDEQAALYNGTTTNNTGCGPGQGESGCANFVDGNNHIWSITANPTFTFLHGDKYGAYAVVGAGYYHKVTNFTTPETGVYDTYYGEIEVTENENFDHYTSNAFGGNVGLGLTYKFSRFADERFFVEARYVITDNAQRQGYVYSAAAGTTIPTGTNPDLNNAFPANSNKSTYIPIKVGVRF